MKHAWQKKIIHVDMDAFYAAIEQRDRPELQGKPVIVGGNPASRGVVSTASYEARKFGVRSAMPSAQAKKLCPQGVFLFPDFKKYKAASEMIMGILRQHTVLVEPMSLDEAYLDVTKNRFGIEDPTVLASLIKQNIKAVTRLTASAGVAPNLFLSKIASDYQKPDGLTVILPGEEKAFLENLPVRKIPGVGPVTEAEIHKLGIRTCGELAQRPLDFLIRNFGKTGVFLYERSHGIDEREVMPGLPSKQISSEETFPYDILDKELLKAKLEEIARLIFDELVLEERMGKTVVLKVKYYDFELITRSRTFTRPISDWSEIYQAGSEMLDKKTLAGSKPVRLIGLGISGLSDQSPPLISEGIILRAGFISGFRPVPSFVISNEVRNMVLKPETFQSSQKADLLRSDRSPTSNELLRYPVCHFERSEKYGFKTRDFSAVPKGGTPSK